MVDTGYLFRRLRLNRIFAGLIAIVGLLLWSTGHASLGQIKLITDGASRYCIYLSRHAPRSVHTAASELQGYLEKATGVQLPLVDSRSVPNCPLISLGSNAASRRVSIGAEAIPLEGYRITVHDGNLYILGPDTPDGKKTIQGGTSTGTLNGVYTFLEEFVGVRWLMPGEMGEHVPELDELVIPIIDRTDEPGFLNRRIPYIQNDKPEVQEWLRRQKQGYSLELRHGHSFEYIIKPELFDKHPDWFPMQNGERVPPVGRYKLETTNPELIMEFTDQVISSFDENPTIFSESISPSDSGNWSTSPESMEFYDVDPHGRTSVTPLVLDFYNKVAKGVGERYANKWVCGYIYADYLFPPSKGMPDLEDNLCLVIAPSLSYGYQLYRDQNRMGWQSIIETWSRESANIAYYDLPTTFASDIGAPNPPGIEILGYIYPRLHLYGLKGVYMYGVRAWGHGAITNYLLAKLNWDPTVNVDEVVNDFFDHAYGVEAGPVMQKIYQLLDSSTRHYYRAHAEARRPLTPEAIDGIYVPVLKKIEQLYEKAAASALTTREKLRLKAFEDNMALFYDYLHQVGLKKINRDSPFFRPEVAIKQLKVDSKKSILVPKRRWLKLKHSIKPRKYRAFQVNPLQKVGIPHKPFVLRGSSRSILYPQNSGTTPVNISLVRSFGEIPEYQVLDKEGEVLATGGVNKKTIVELELSPGQIYILDVIANSAAYEISAPSATIALSSGIQNRGLHLQKNLTTLYFYVPESVAEFSVTISASGPGETAAAYLLSPDGHRVAGLDTEGRNADKVRVSEAGDRSGFWALQWKTPIVGSIDDVWVKLDDSIPPWFYLYPSKVAFGLSGSVDNN